MEKFKYILKYVVIVLVFFIVLNIDDKGENNIAIENVEGNFFSIMAKKIEEILVSLITFIFDMVKKIFNLIFSI